MPSRRSADTPARLQPPAAVRRLYVLDTNVLMHDPSCIFRFQEHDIFLPMVVLEELDAGKKGVSESARNVRQVSRFLDEMMHAAGKPQIDRGLPIPGLHHDAGAAAVSGQVTAATGRLFFQTELLPTMLPETLPGNTADNHILGTTLALQHKHPERRVILVSKDINLRIKAAVLGVHAEDYYNDKALDDLDLLFSGVRELPPNFWDKHGTNMESWQQEGRTFYRIQGPQVRAWHPNEFLYSEADNFEAMVRGLDQRGALLELTRDYRGVRHTVWGINARNREQNFALNLLLKPDVDFVTLLGAAGTGKTLLALAAGLAQTLEQNRYREIIMTRVTVPLGEDIGFLPGTEEEKMTPWMGALMDNLEVLTQSNGEGGEWGRAATGDLLRNRIKIRSMNFMRGRTFLNRYIIVDEAQNLTPKQLKALVTRAGPGTKMVCIGNISQIDTPYLTETTSGLTFVVDRFKDWPHSGHITLLRGERSRLADYASEIL
ncbi:MAG: PhoH family protein [Gammaproteobacteria bacterium]|nr:PhoH family protein [Gammaproteobacteria bacterium]MDE2274645.1 PhoH family protein [Gammaproteobacteria bacterium]